MNLQKYARLKAIRLDRNAFQITVIYLLIGGLWILFSDRFVEAISTNTQTLTTLSTYKGWFYVLVTGLLLYWLIHRNNLRIQRDAAELQVAEKNYKEMFDNATVGIYRSTPDGRLLAVNPKLASMFGYDSPEEMLASISDIGKQVYKDSTRRDEYRRTITEQGFINEFVNEERRKDGSWIWTSTTARTVNDEAGNILYYEGFTIDVTEQKQIEAELSESEEHYKLIFEHAPLAINITSGTTITYANPAYLKMFGYSSLDELQSVGPLELFTPEWRPSILENIQRRAKGLPTPNNYEAECLRKDGTKFPILMYLTSVMFSAQQVTLGFILDITERKEANEALRKAEEKYHTIFNESIEGIFQSTPEGKFLTVNPALAHMLGYKSPEEMISGIQDIANEIYVDADRRAVGVKQIQEHDQLYGFEFQAKRKNGEIIWVSENARAVRDSAGTLLYFEGQTRDITERKQVEEKYQSLVEQIPVVIYEAEIGGRTLFVSPQVEKFTSFSSREWLEDRNLWIKQLHPEDQQRVLEENTRAIFENREYILEYRIIGKEGNIIWIHDEGPPIQLTPGTLPIIRGIWQNITERKQSAEQLHASEIRFSKIFESSPIGIGISRLSDGVFTDANDALLKIFDCLAIK